MWWDIALTVYLFKKLVVLSSQMEATFYIQS